eukprot:Trichotokara_eunicae@DN4576_c0_g1_i1.p1
MVQPEEPPLRLLLEGVRGEIEGRREIWIRGQEGKEIQTEGGGAGGEGHVPRLKNPLGGGDGEVEMHHPGGVVIWMREEETEKHTVNVEDDEECESHTNQGRQFVQTLFGVWVVQFMYQCRRSQLDHS